MPTEPTSVLTAEIVHKFFPELTEQQRDQFAKLDGLYRDWNAKINVISRKDIDNLYPNHILHSLAIAKVVRFLPGAKILDLGTGGAQLRIGFPHLSIQRSHQLMEEATTRTQLVAVAHGAANDTTQHIATPFIGRQHPISNQEGARANVISDHAQ